MSKEQLQEGSRLYIVSIFGTVFDRTGLYYPRKFHDPTLLMIRLDQIRFTCRIVKGQRVGL